MSHSKEMSDREAIDQNPVMPIDSEGGQMYPEVLCSLIIHNKIQLPS